VSGHGSQSPVALGVLAAAVMLLSSGCAGYRLGSTSDIGAGGRSVQVGIFQNKTKEPRLIEAVSSALRRRLQQDGSLRLNTHGDGDILVKGEITHFDRAGLTYQPGDILTVRDYSLAMSVHVMAIERSTGRVLLDRTVGGHTTIRVGNDLSSAERQAIPLIADDLAKNLTSALVDGVW
jgi:hypothetical protein